MQTINVVLWLASLGVFSTLTGVAWHLGRVHIKSLKLRHIGDLALQAVEYAESIAGQETGPAQKQVATKFLGELLIKPHLDKLVTPGQVDSVLEIALLKLKALGGANEN